MTLEPTESPEARKTGHRWIDLFVAFSALFISALSIFLGQQTGNSMEKLVHANSWPFLELGSGNTDGQQHSAITLGVENVGTGPAAIYWFEVEMDGAPLRRDGHMLTNLLSACCRDAFDEALARHGGSLPATFGYEVSSPLGSRFLASNGDIDAMRWPRTEDNAELWDALDRARQTRMTMSACYCSVFEECWIARSNTFPPDKVDSCTAGQAPIAAP